MNGIHEEKRKKTRIIWISAIVVGVALIAALSVFFVLKSNQKKHYTSYMEKAENYYKIKQYDDAIVAYRSAIKTDKKQYRSYEGLSDVYVAMGDYTQARMVLQEGIDATDSLILREIYIDLADMKDMTQEQNEEQDEKENKKEWNDSLIAMIGGYSYQQYSNEYGAGVVYEQNDGCRVEYKEVGATLYYTEIEGEEVINGETGKPFDGRVPSYVTVNDLTVIFNEMNEAMTIEEVCAITGSEAEIKTDSQNGYYLWFEYLNCQFEISCDENGTIADSSAKNKLIPLAKSQEGDMGIVTGTVVDATTGNPIEEVTVNFRRGSGSEIQANVPADNYTMEFAKDGYITEYVEISVSKGDTVDFGTKALSPTLAAGEWRIVLEWGEQPADLDSHLVSDSYHVSFQNPNAGSAELDVDDRDGNGPETITITEFDQNAHYDYYVHDFTNASNPGSTALGNSGAFVKVYLPNGETKEFSVPAGSGNVWHVFSIDNGVVQEVNQLNSGDV